MGGQQSHPQPPPLDMMDHHHQQYPDMNMIFKGIPKMIQVADDMHRMTNYIMDLRNMTLALVAISAIGMIGFLLLRALHGRNQRARRKRSLVRHADEHPTNSMPRYYYQSQYNPDPWERPKSQFSHVDEQKKVPLSERTSPENQRPNGSINYKSFSNEDGVLPSSAHPDTPPKPSLADVPVYCTPNGAHKRPLEPIKLMVEDLPYADDR